MTNPTPNDLKYQIALLEMHRIGHVVARKLIENFGSAEAVFNLSDDQFKDLGRIGEDLRTQVGDHKLLSIAEHQLNYVNQSNARAIGFFDPDYPKRLKHCVDAPLVLYQRGNVSLNHSKMVAVVGTRNCTNYGKNFCKNLVTSLKEYDVHFVSGLAFGIDASLHLNACDLGVVNTAVVAHGLDKVYPKEHGMLSDRILQNGSVLTEYKTQTRPDRENFPTRNRIVAGMVDAVVVVESAIRGGSMITAKLGNDYNRDVFALPGRATDSQSEGCNHLIKTNRAHLLSKPEDIPYLLNWSKEDVKPKAVQKQLFVDLTPEQQTLVDAIGNATSSIDEIMLASKLPMSKVSAELLMLEFKGLVKQLPGKMYQMN